ncbi:lysoplasmalogenase [Hyphobacterium sp.]|uniref:lysoplasmalogenase n=1 Tax=Hyphobacterium sp. TaxID=2004662 RepID=UPI003B526757
MTASEHRTGLVLLFAAAALALLYLLTGYGVPIAYPATVALKASGILLLAVFAARRQAFLLALALAASAIGDAMLVLDPVRMTLGIAAFGTAHLVYGWIFLRQLRKSGLRGPVGYGLAALLVVFGVAMLAWIQPGMGELRIPATAYNAIILVMAILAVMSRAPWLAVIGALLFLASDSLIALDLFRDYDPAWRGPAVWISYVAAQFCLTLGLVRERP